MIVDGKKKGGGERERKIHLCAASQHCKNSAWNVCRAKDTSWLFGNAERGTCWFGWQIWIALCVCVYSFQNGTAVAVLRLEVLTVATAFWNDVL